MGLIDRCLRRRTVIRSKYQILLFFGCLLGLTTASLSVVSAQAQDYPFDVLIAQPAEQETFYVGPSTFVYSIPVNGRVSGPLSDFTQVELTLEIYQGGNLIDSAFSNPFPDGVFEFRVTVNPESTQGGFTLERKECEFCHTITETALPSGFVLIRVTARFPKGETASDERHIIVDHSTMIEVPITVVLENPDGEKVSSVRVAGSTWIYLWRARHFTGTTDEVGKASLSVEVLSQAPTHYIFQINPYVIDGVQYESIEPVEITLQPGVEEAPPLILRVHAQRGEISGHLLSDSSEPIEGIEIYGISSSFRDFVSDRTDSDGAFSFSDIPLDMYTIFADWNGIIEALQRPEAISIDLSDQPRIQLQINAEPIHGMFASGRILDSQAMGIPFAWVTSDDFGLAHSVLPWSGRWFIDNLPDDEVHLMVHAPGYFSQDLYLRPSMEFDTPVDVELQHRPETVRLAWGEGEIIIPPESKFTHDREEIFFQSGWIWGSGSNREPVTIHLDNAVLTIEEGVFALEATPQRVSWFYLMEGEARVTLLKTGLTISLSPGSMVALSGDSTPAPIQQNKSLFFAFHSEMAIPINPVWELSLPAMIQRSLEKLGIGIAQSITLVTFGLAIISLIVLPIGLYIGWRRQRKSLSANLKE